MGLGIDMLQTGIRAPSRKNIVGHAKGVYVSNIYTIAHSTRLDWDRLPKNEGSKLILKGILDADDARMALKVGGYASLFRKTGGRQLDGAPSSIRVLPEVYRSSGRPG
jgi:L-lactate dehydrogenase (cytochrome)